MRRVAGAWVGMVAGLSLALIARPAAGEQTDTLFEPPEASFIAPGRLFAANIPIGWKSRIIDENTVEFTVTAQAGSGTMIVRRVPVPKGASAIQLLIKSIEGRLSKLPSFRQIERRLPEIAGIKGAGILGSYNYQGNVAYPRAVEETIIVVGKEAFQFHFECFRPATSYFAQELEIFYGGFVPRPASAIQDPYHAPRIPSDDDTLEHIPF